MDWVEVPFVAPARTKPRSPGLHLSDLVREIERDVLGDDKRPAGEIPTGFAEGGFIWEGMAQAMAERYLGKGLTQFEAKMDRVWLTSDWVPYSDGTVWDFKYSLKSTSHIGKWDSSFLGYMVQMKSHCRYFETTKGTLLFLFAMGNWARGDDWSGPQVRRFDFTFTADELEANWAWVMRYKAEYEKRGGPRPYAAGAKTRAVKTVGDEGGFRF